MVDRVLADVPYRQWVLSLPWDLRALCARRAEVLTAVSRVLWRSLRAELCNRSGLPNAEPAAVTFVQRFGGSLNLNVHLHVVTTDGVFVLAEGSGVRFVPLPEPRAEQLERVVERARASILRWLRRKGYFDDGDGAPPEAEPDAEPDGLEACQRLALRYGTLVGLSNAPPADGEQARFEPRRRHRCHARTEDGFDLDARVHIAQGDDRGRERLVRYCARPALVLERLERLPDGRYAYRTKYRRNGRTHRVMSGPELMARIAALVPPPRYPLVRYHGCFAPAHVWRPSVVPKPPRPRASCTRAPEPSDRPRPAPPPEPPPPPPVPSPGDLLEPCELRSPFVLSDPHLRRLLDGLLVMRRPRADWATLLRRSHHLDVLDCPRCHGRLRPLAAVRDRAQARRLLDHLGHPHEPLALAPARDPTLDFGA